MRQLKSRAISRKVQAQYADIVLDAYKEKRARARQPKILTKEEFVRAMTKGKENRNAEAEAGICEEDQ